MGESNRVDLNKLARGLDPLELAEVADFVGFLISRRDRDADLEKLGGRWEVAGASDMAASIEELERDLPPGDVRAWLADLKASARPVRFDAESGELEDAGA